MVKETNPERWERIKREAARDGVDPYDRLLDETQKDPRQFVRAKREEVAKSKRST